MSLGVGKTPELDAVWKDSADSHSIQPKTSCYIDLAKVNDKHVEFGQLYAVVQDLILRVTKLEEKTIRQSLRLPTESIVGTDKIPERDSKPSGRSKLALSVVDRHLITSKPHNEGIFCKFRNGLLVLRRYNFAIVQFLLMLVAVAGLIIFGAMKFFDAHQSVNDPYKPYKVDGRDEYYRNEDLRYELPLHYFWFEFAVSESNFSEIYNHTFNGTCDSTLKTCLGRYIGDLMNPSFALSPTDLPTRSPSKSPTKNPTSQPTDQITTWSHTMTDLWTFLQDPGKTETENIYNAPVSAECVMTTSTNGTVKREFVELRNLTLHLDQIGINLQNYSDVTDIFGMLMRLEFDDFKGHMSGKIMCDLYLEIERLQQRLSGFASYDIMFLVSREEFNSGSTGISEYIRSMKKVWRWQNELIDQVYSYVFEENTFDGVSDFTAEVHLVDEVVNKDAMLNIEVYPYPTVMHYVSFDRYSYLDWIADIGGFYTLAIGFFFLLTTRITKFANRRHLFQRKWGILPAVSLSHRNAEEISGIRSLVMAALGITDEEYFELNVERKSMLRETLRKSALRKN